MQLIHTLNDAVEGIWNGITLFRYVYAPQMPQLESPKPYFHPLRTLHGNTVSAYKPWDHAWHKGLSFTCAELSGENFWGGVTFVEGQGYVQLENNGSQVHLGWDELSSTGSGAVLAHRLEWRTQAGDRWLQEARRWELAIDEANGLWSLCAQSSLRNVSGRVLEWGSPTTAGRENAGYGGLFLRMPREFVGAKLLAAGTLEGSGIMGQRAAWMAMLGRHDETFDHTTLLFVDSQTSLRHPTPWFVRNSETPVASFAFSFHEIYEQQPEETIHLKHKIIIANGHRSAEECAALALDF